MTGSPAAGAAGTVGGVQALIDCRRGAPAVEQFLAKDGPQLVAGALRAVLPDGARDVRCEVTRSRLLPHRKLSAYVDVHVPGAPARPAAVVWTGDPGRMEVLVAPVDPAFPQLASLYNLAHLAELLTGAGQRGFDKGLAVRALRYRPGQRHVLRIDGTDPQASLYAKCYRDHTGARAVAGSHQVAAALASWGGPARVAHARAYLGPERVVLWATADGAPLSQLVAHDPTLARAAGAALRALHDAGGRAGGASSPTAEAAATRRACAHVIALHERSGSRLLQLLERTVADLEDMPAETGYQLHGDFKCDNILVDGDILTILDFDRVTTGDPALDLGKLRADLRWWALAGGTDGDGLVAALLDGYGPMPRPRAARAARYDVLFQLRSVGRRVLLHQPRWAETVDACLTLAARTARSGR
ncbi:phosphotransferase [Georgenia sp. SYP-B2076]|uniref:phosphotransferase n=1 Tax=Georgenia sp. SYP-B2076 TaxID=2495881 RepID=UPI000F8F5ADB|nr:phosphotransferase [Georgenia sp. SYP-B2076]